MPWPLSQDYNEAIQTPAQCFSDPELQRGEAVTNALGLPIPCSGNFADVYAVQSGQQKWAVKCFTRQIQGLRERYAEISKYLQQVKLPFMVDFKFLEQGIRVRGQWYPILKMQWVEGQALNTFVKSNLDRPQVLEKVCAIWLKLTAGLRQANVAHGDLQHGNVLLVPGEQGKLSLRLVDYDGMCVPALEMLKATEVGHPAYQHPQRLREGTYNLGIDRFSHLVIYTALRSLIVGGRKLWERFDNGDNLLFSQKDFESPQASALFQELQKTNDPEVKKLTQALTIASQKPLDQAPSLDKHVPTESGGLQSFPQAPGPRTGVNQAADSPFAAVTASGQDVRHPRRSKGKKSGVLLAVGIGLATVTSLVAGGFILLSTQRMGESNSGTAVAQNRPGITGSEKKLLTSPVAEATSHDTKKTLPDTKLILPLTEAPAVVDLHKLVDVKRDAVKGVWMLQDKTLVSPPDALARLQVPYTPPTEYDLTMVVERRKGTGPIVVGLMVEGRQCLAEIDGHPPTGYVSGLGSVDGKMQHVNETTRAGQVLTNAKPSVIVYSVRKGAVTATVDGNTAISYKGDSSRLSLPGEWAVPNNQSLFVGSYDTVYCITKMEVTPVSGQSRQAAINEHKHYLVDLAESNYTPGQSGWQLGKGHVGNGTKIRVKTEYYPKGLGLVPGVGKPASVKYSINGEMSIFVARIAFHDTGEARSPVVFQVVADKVVVWSSKPLRNRNTIQDVSVSVAGKSILELRTICDGNNNAGCYAVWLDPYLLK